VARTREQVLAYLDIERQYQDHIRAGKKSVAEELVLARHYLDAANEAFVLANRTKGRDYQLVLRNLRRVAANIVRCLEEHQVWSDQQEQRTDLGIAQEPLWAKRGI